MLRTNGNSTNFEMKFINMKKGLLLGICSLFFWGSCLNDSISEQNTGTQIKLQYAKMFSVNETDEYVLINVRNPWDSTQILQTYVLVDREKKLPDNLPIGTLVRTPVKSAIAFSTIHCSSLDEIDALDVVTGVCEPQYISIDKVQDSLRAGSIADVGVAANPDIEKILMLEPDVLFVTPIHGENYGQIEKMNIPIIETPDYMESEPLGRAEWIKFYSFFVGKESLADSLFNITVRNYNSIKELTNREVNKPTVFTDTKYQASWNVPGGKSFLANMLADAGALYAWNDDNSTSFHPLSFETVLDKAGDADLWLIKYYSPADMTYESLEKEYEPYTLFKAYKKMGIYQCNTFHSKYFEDLPIHPDYILRDFAAIFHPHLFPDYENVYYKSMKK